MDLESMNPGVQVLEVKNSQSVRIESVKFDPRFENKQRLRMIFTNVVSSTLANLEVTETVQVMLYNNIFSWIFLHLQHQTEFGARISNKTWVHKKETNG